MYIILVSNYHGCKGEAINLMPHYLIDIIHKTVKPSNWILMKQIIVSSTHFVMGETDFQKILPRVLIEELGHE